MPLHSHEKGGHGRSRLHFRPQFDLFGEVDPIPRFRLADK